MYKKIVEFRPSISSENIVDHIIQYYISKQMDDMFGDHLTVTMPTRSYLTKQNLAHINTSDYSFVCGTNLLASNMDKRRQWDLRKNDMFRVHDVVLLGVGWWQYQEKPNGYTKTLLKRILSSQMIHSVRDSYTEQMLRAAGIQNVLNTGCPTMWGLSQEKVNRIPACKGSRVVTTLTNYMQNDELDRYIIKTLLTNYEVVFVWLQAIEDYNQLCRMGYDDKVKIIPPTLKAYNELLMMNDIDYIGTRLHGGIHALNNEKRSLIIAVDNRAKEISKDTKLPVIGREDVKGKLESMINDTWKTEIEIPITNIQKWKSQFISESAGINGGYSLTLTLIKCENFSLKEACA